MVFILPLLNRIEIKFSKQNGKKGKKHMLSCHSCKCKRYAFIPSRPEDVGEFWFARRRNFDNTTYRVKCKCKHSHDSHDPTLFNCNL